ncbi:MAG: hypothetical protein K9M11_03840 [Candidatus Pacebacteria bacterium]|nr:hypothetical protein [Candidatus Paceibacterota bacterium]
MAPKNQTNQTTQTASRNTDIDKVDVPTVHETTDTEVSSQSMPVSPHSSVKNRGLYDKVSFWVISIAILLLPIFVIPFTNISFFYAKFGLVSAAVLVAAITFILQILNERKVERYSILHYVFLFGIPVLYVISSLFVSHSGSGLMGNGAEVDTAFFLFLGSILMYLISKFFRSKHSIFMIVLGIVSVATIVELFHTLRFLFGKSFLSLGIFNSISSNTIGSFNELGVYAGLIVLISILALELTTIRKGVRSLFYVAITLSLVIIAGSNFNLVNSVLGFQFGITLSSLILLFSLVLFIHKKVTNPRGSLPTASLIVLLVSLVLTIGIMPISAFVSQKIGIVQNEILDVRVSPSATYTVAKGTYMSGIKEAVLGVGPNNFYSAWGKYKPTDIQNSVNNTAFWNVDFNMASGFIPTTFVTVGILGGLGWIFFLALIIFYVTKLLRNVARPDSDPTSVFGAWVVSVGTVYLWIISLLYTTGPTMILMAFIFTGLFLATLVREDIIKTKMVMWDISTYWKGFSVTFGMVILIALLMYIGYIWEQRVYASIQIQQASKMLQSDPTKITEAETVALNSINTYFNTSDLRFLAEVALIRPSNLIGKAQGVVPQEKLTQEVISDITLAINAARRATIDKGMSDDYRDWLQLGKVYETATFLGATTTATLAVESYAQAERLNPTNPVPPYLIGRLYALARGFDIAEVKLKRAIELKSDYAEAVNLLGSVQDVNKGTQKSSIAIPEENASTTKSDAANSTTSNTKTGTTKR